MVKKPLKTETKRPAIKGIFDKFKKYDCNPNKHWLFSIS